MGFALALTTAKNTKQKKVELGAQLALCHRKRLILFSLLALVQQGIQAATAMSFSMQIVTSLGGSLKEVGIASTIYMISAVLWAKFSSTKQCERISVKGLIPAVFVMNAVYLLLMPEVNQISQIYVLQILPGMATGLLFSSLTAEAMKGIAAEVKSTAMGLYQTIYAVGMTLLPMLGGTVVQNASMRMAYRVFAGICFVAAILAVCVRKWAEV